MRDLKVLDLYNAESSSTVEVYGDPVDLAEYIHVGGRELKAFLRVHGSTDSTTDSTVAAKLQESATTSSSDFSDISGATFTGGGYVDAVISEELHFQAAQRYVRLAATPAGTAATIKAGIVAGLVAVSRGTT
jgi:hypothetical protein